MIRPTRRAAILLAGCLAAACSPTQSATADKEPPPAVTIARPLLATVPQTMDLTGTVTASASVDLMARVAGTVATVDFADGARVRKGQPLFHIAPETYQAQLAASSAQLSQTAAEYTRQQRLFADDATSRAALDNARFALEQAQANQRLGRINLSYTIVRAPFDGWMSSAAISAGGYVAPGATKLATIQQIDPLSVEFTLGERQVLQVLAAMRARGQADAPAASRYPVAIGLLDQPDYPYRATLDFAQKAIDTATGSLQARAVLSGTGDATLLPGMFARVRIAFPADDASLLLPVASIQSDPLGDYVFVLDKDHIVRRRDIRTGGDVGPNRVVLGGLSPAHWVIVDGLVNVRIGGKAKPRTTMLALPEAAQ
ncbi:efflux RND transporter periplasmic adaptor subunit [Sphingomonas sp. 37zxx]|uniref:efflux RND transporter periplasmic adaptor subunit n=1 Tax=Sphingomonas sp. 37zxx TaxID=1550073 RepID=UPI00068E08A3|nr:efflux RND transporter periplasmic adaptor subunit [Sphingomonas sp. 37zxx]